MMLTVPKYISRGEQSDDEDRSSSLACVRQDSRTVGQAILPVPLLSGKTSTREDATDRMSVVPIS